MKAPIEVLMLDHGDGRLCLKCALLRYLLTTHAVVHKEPTARALLKALGAPLIRKPKRRA